MKYKMATNVEAKKRAFTIFHTLKGKARKDEMEKIYNKFYTLLKDRN